MKTQDYIAREDSYLAHNYNPLPVVLTRGEGVWMWDVEGKKYLDFLSAYSAVSAGHNNPRIKKALMDQMNQLDVPCRAFRTPRLGEFAEALCRKTGLDMMLPMNTGAEAIETAIKAARRWGYTVKGIPENKARIITCSNNFHGRTTTIVSFSTDQKYKENFGPFDGGFDTIPFGDAQALEKAITPDTCAFLVEPIQAEAGILIPPKGWLREAQTICKKHNVLLMLDEIQTGMARTGKDFCFQHEIDKPDALMLGKALGGGVYPVSAFIARKDVMDVFTPGTHGSTFGGNPIAAAVGLESLAMLEDEQMAAQSTAMGEYLMNGLKSIQSPVIKDIRGMGLLIGVEIDPKKTTARTICEQLLDKGLLCKETHEVVVRFAPPLIIQKNEIDWAITKIADVFSAIDSANNVR